MHDYWQPEGFHQLGEGELSDILAKDVLSRMKEVTNTASQEELAEWLCEQVSHLSDAKQRNIIPIRWIRLLVEKRVGYNPIWVLSGKGEKFW